MGLSAIAIIFFFKRFLPRIPGSLVALVLGIVVSYVLDLSAKGVDVVGEVTTGLPEPSLPFRAVPSLFFLILGAGGIVFLAVGESLGAAQTFASKHRYDIDPDQELLALGAANLSSGIFGGFTADASLSQSAAADAAGAQSQLSSLLTALLFLATILFLAPLFTSLPQSVLAAIVITGVLGLMDFNEVRRYWRLRRLDFVLAVIAIVGVVALGVLFGLVVAVALSIVSLIYRASRPYVAVLGRLTVETQPTFGDIGRHADAERIPGVLILRLDAPLYFFNSDRRRTADAGPRARRRAAPATAHPRHRRHHRAGRDHPRHARRPVAAAPRGIHRAPAGAGEEQGQRPHGEGRPARCHRPGSRLPVHHRGARRRRQPAGDAWSSVAARRRRHRPRPPPARHRPRPLPPAPATGTGRGRRTRLGHHFRG